MKNFIEETLDLKIKNLIIDVMRSNDSSYDISDVILHIDESNKKLNSFYKNELLGNIEVSFKDNICNMKFFPKN